MNIPSEQLGILMEQSGVKMHNRMIRDDEEQFEEDKEVMLNAFGPTRKYIKLDGIRQGVKYERPTQLELDQMETSLAICDICGVGR